jgi:hypothetical protein
MCASCGGAPEKTVGVIKGLLRLDIPYCKRCAAFAQVPNPRALALCALAAVLCVGLAFLLAFSGHVATPLLFAAPCLLVLPVIVALWYGVALRFLGASTSPSSAVRIAHADASGASLFCTHKGWAEAFASSNGGEAVPGKAREPLSPWVISVIPFVTIGPITSFAAWNYANPEVYIDNGFSSPIQVWVDGERREVVPPALGDSGRSTIRVPHGHHVLGYSPVGAASPTATVEATINADLRNRDQYLYNPGRMACHYVDVVLYTTGSGAARLNPRDRASLPNHLLGPLPISELYHLDKIDFWLEPAPDTIDTRGRGRMYRTVLLRNYPCMALARKGCSLQVREELVKCEASVTNDEEILECIHAAESACAQEPRGPLSL